MHCLQTRAPRPAAAHHHQWSRSILTAQRPADDPSQPSRASTVTAASVVWRQLEGSNAWVAHPRSARVSGVCHFLGGAFAGAAPQVLYSLLIELLAGAGYTVIATPYQVTFQHLECARQVRGAFLDAVQELRAQGRGYLAPASAPVHGVGHSNGALLHLLVGALHEAPVTSNVIISFNNLQVRDAIPIPGLLNGLRPAVTAARGLPPLPLPLPLPTLEQVLARAAAAVPPPLLKDPQLLAGATPLLRQLDSVVGEVGDGISEFTPSPEESRALIARGYQVAATLLVRFADDSIDQTPEVASILRQPPPPPSFPSQQDAVIAPAAGANGASASGYEGEQPSPSGVGGGRASAQRVPGSPPAAAMRQVDELVLPGSHVTPCGGDIVWDAGPVFTPVDALAQGVKAEAQADVRRLAARIVEWLRASQGAA